LKLYKSQTHRVSPEKLQKLFVGMNEPTVLEISAPIFIGSGIE